MVMGHYAGFSVVGLVDVAVWSTLRMCASIYILGTGCHEVGAVAVRNPSVLREEDVSTPRDAEERKGARV